MDCKEIRYWLDRYGEKVQCLILFCEDISVAAGCVSDRSIKFVADDSVLFNENYFDNVVYSIQEAIDQVKEKHLVKYIETVGKHKGEEVENRISHIILHGANATGGFGIWVVRSVSPENNAQFKKALDNQNIRALGLMFK